MGKYNIVIYALKRYFFNTHVKGENKFMILGNVMVGQSGGPTSVINSSLVGVYKTAKNAGCQKIYGMKNGIEGLLKSNYVDLSNYIKNDIDVELLKRTPSSFLGSCRYKMPKLEENPAIYEQLFNILKKLDIKYFFYIGGNDSMDTVLQLSRYASAINSDIRFMGVPKTIDNDLAVTDHTPGYGSAAKYIASAMKEVILDATPYDIDSITIIEIMGRNAGWLTAASALSRTEDCLGPDLIYLPESTFDCNKFLNKVKDLKKEQNSVVIAVSEGIRTSDGKYVCESGNSNLTTDPFGHKFLGGTAMFLANFLKSNLGIKARGIEFSTLQRCASHIVSKCDIDEAFNAGSEAVLAALNGETGKMIIFKRISNTPYHIATDLCDISLIANAEKVVPPEWITDDATNISDEFIKYARPLIIGELAPFMVDGLPRHLTLK